MKLTSHSSWQDLPSFATRQRRKRKYGRIKGFAQRIGIGLLSLALGGLLGPLTPMIRMEMGYKIAQARAVIPDLIGNLAYNRLDSRLRGNDITTKPVVFSPLTTPDGATIDPVDTNFGLIIPKIGINAKVIPAVNPTNPGEYEEALTKGVAHASTSYFPNENGTVYLFSHSTSYDWLDRKSTRLNSSHLKLSRMPSSA